MKRIFLVVFVTIIILNPKSVIAHPGNTASDGCHYCRTNCAKWGEVEGARHCHGGGVVETIPLPVVTSAPKPTIKPTSAPKPTSTPTPKRSSSDITQQTNNSSDDDWLMSLLALGGIGFGGYQVLKNKK